MRQAAGTPAVAADVGAGWNVLPIHYSAFQIFDFTLSNFSNNSVGYLFTRGPSFVAIAPVQLPSGAQIGRVALYAYDVDPANDVLVRLRRFTGFGSVAGCSPCGLPVPPADELIVMFSSSGTPGYQFSDITPGVPHTVENQALQGGGQYAVYVSTPATTDGALGFRGVEIWWKRQISPAPAVASFVDVPTTHQFFREIEALAAAGITLGCTATQYCPNATVTRAQMAAFFARALGLYWQY